MNLGQALLFCLAGGVLLGIGTGSWAIGLFGVMVLGLLTEVDA